MSGEIPVATTIAFGMGIDKANVRPNAGTMMASFFNESDLKKCLKNCDFCRIPDNVKRVCTHEVSDKMEKLMNHSDMSQAIVRTVIQALDDNSSQTDNQQRAADIEYNSCYLQSKMLNSYNHKAAQSYVVFI
ncbi:hypothetical protein WR25_10548 [Diploscapter pachys]|uniref:Uncharacterized protein n=1 Tax=Diploscapter pachys TaxID=2018661 RepID=A0A2A2J2W8_9BILA|nr:hypothetical protein WR25_10548 [Diploscapter pachys]